VQTTLPNLSCKHFLLLIYTQEGEKKEEINGADFTKIENAVRKYIPSLED